MKKLFKHITLICILIMVFIEVFSVKSFTLAADYSYTGESYYATISTWLFLRDASLKENDNNIIPSGSTIYVFGFYRNNSSYLVVEYNGKKGLVANVSRHIHEISSSSTTSSKYPHTDDEFYAKLYDWFYFRDTSLEKNRNRIIPSGTTIHILGTYKNNSSFWVVEYNSEIGLVVKNSDTIIRVSSESSGTSNSGYPYTVKLADWFYFRYNPSEIDKNRIVPKESEVIVTDMVNSNGSSYLAIKYNGRSGYIYNNSKFIIKTVSNFDYSGYSYNAIITETAIMRSENGSRMCALNSGTYISVLGIDNNNPLRSVISYNGRVGTVLTECLSSSNASQYNNAIIINIASQTVKMYRNGNLICSGLCVTGQYGEYDTPKGKYYIQSLEPNYHFTKYGDTTVAFWMQYNGNYGLHDANWRDYDEFGGNTYKYNGSHGCTNLPYDLAKKIYSNCYVGMPVIIE